MWLVSFVVLSMAAACSRNPADAARKYVERGDQYAKAGRYREAAIEYANAVRRQPDSVTAHERLADAAARSNDPATASREVLQIAELDPTNVEAQLRASALHLLAGRYEDARDGAAAVLALDAANADAELLLGQALSALNDPKGSEASLRAAVRLAPASADTHLALGVYLWARGHKDEAESECRRAVELDPASVHANNAMAMLYMATGRPARAEPLWKTVASTQGANRSALANFYLSQGRNDDARAELEKLAIDPARHNDAEVRVAAIEYASGRSADAHARLEAILDHEPAFVPALIARTRFLVAEGKLPEALGVARSAQRAAPTSPEAVYLEGVIQEASQSFDAAVQAYAATLQRQPNAARAAIAIARIRLRQGRSVDAADWAEHAAKAQPRDIGVRLASIELLLAARDVQAAVDAARGIAADFPRVAQTHAALGRALHAARQDEESRRAFQAALALAPESLEALAGLAGLDVEEHHPAAARALVDAQLRRQPRSPELLLLGGQVALEAGATADAESMLKRAIDVAPSMLAAYQALGALYVRTQQLPAALQELGRVEQARPGTTGASTMIAMVLEAQGRASEARAKYEQVLARTPRSPIAANNLAWLLLADGRTDEALRLATIAHEELHSAPEIDDTLGWAYFKAGRHADAIRTLAEAVQSSPDQALYRYHLGMAFLGAGDARNAQQELERAVASAGPFTGKDEAGAALRELRSRDEAQ